MQCKVGDLALIVRADNDSECLGRIVQVVALQFAFGAPAWQVDPPTYWRDESTGKTLEVVWDDRDLKPLLPGDGVDEMLLLTGYPAAEEHAV